VKLCRVISFARAEQAGKEVDDRLSTADDFSTIDDLSRKKAGKMIH
jgi:hypothetical protein